MGRGVCTLVGVGVQINLIPQRPVLTTPSTWFLSSPMLLIPSSHFCLSLSLSLSLPFSFVFSFSFSIFLPSRPDLFKVSHYLYLPQWGCGVSTKSLRLLLFKKINAGQYLLPPLNLWSLGPGPWHGPSPATGLTSTPPNRVLNPKIARSCRAGADTLFCLSRS